MPIYIACMHSDTNKGIHSPNTKKKTVAAWADGEHKSILKGTQAALNKSYGRSEFGGKNNS